MYWRRLRLVVVTFLLLTVLTGTGMAKELKRDPDTGMIRVLYIGSPFSAFCPYPIFRSDPLLSTTPVSGLAWLDAEIVKKAMRLYMPRTPKDYANYDVVGLDDASFQHFPTHTLVWMRDSVIDYGLGFFMGGGSGSFGGAHGYPSYADTPLQEVMPVECIPQFIGFSLNQVTNLDDDFIQSVPWEDFENHNVFALYNVVELKQGAVQLSELMPLTGGRRDPGWTWWDVGNGRFFASPTGFRGTMGGGTTSAGVSFIYWKHYPDFVSNMAYFVAGLTPPSDTQLLYNTRLKFREVDYHRQMITGTMEFVSRFGAHSGKVDEKLAEAEQSLAMAREFFVDMDLARAVEEAEHVLSILREADALALRAKRAALFWVFLTEWLVVTATLLLCGSALWTLMVRRRLYREVPATRIRPL